MKNYKDVDSFFISVLENIDEILKSNFYEKKGNLLEIKEKINKWYLSFKKNLSLKGISAEDLEFIDKEITVLFDEYIASEPVKENYVERISYDFSHLKRYWEGEMLE